MAHDKQLFRIASVFPGVVMHPGQGVGHIVHVGGMLAFGQKAVIDTDKDPAPPA